MKKAIVLLSGGMDSLVTASIAKKENDEVYFLHFNYHQRTEERELAAFEKICDFYQPTGVQVVDIDFIKAFGGNALTDTSLQVARTPPTPPCKGGHSRIPNTYVPYRNGIFISIACGWAEVLGAERIYIGAVEVDGSGYPDCREVFFETLQIALNYGTKDDFHIEICRPLINLKKSEIVRLGAKLNTPFELSWSCYVDNDVACGECDSCVLRLRAFREAGVDDPIKYRSM